MTISLFGHRNIWDWEGVWDKVENILYKKIREGYTKILIGNHGEFDQLVLRVCLYLKRNYFNNLKIIVAFTSLNIFGKNKSIDNYNASLKENKNFETCFYDIENVYFKNRIIYTNRKMIDESDLVICYVNMDYAYSGAKLAIKYALKKGKEVINLY